MGYMFTDSGKGDVRAQRTRKRLKEEYLRMREEEGKDVTVSALAKRAGVDRKTFYLHYSGIDDLTDEIADDMVRTIAGEFTGDMEHDILTIYELIDSSSEEQVQMLIGPGNSAFRRRLWKGVFSAGAFGEYEKRSEYPQLLSGYFTCIVDIYRQYVKNTGERHDIKRLARQVSEILLTGVSQTDVRNSGGGYMIFHAYYSIRYSCSERFCRVA